MKTRTSTIASLVTLLILLVVGLPNTNVAIQVQAASYPIPITEWTQVTTNPLGDVGTDWSPDGARILYTAKSDSWNRNVWSIDVDGTDATQLTFFSVAEAGNYSSDGSRIVFHQYHSDSRTDILVMNADGSEVTPLRTSGYNQSPDWSPDGSKIAFHSASSLNGTFHIYTMNADGSNVTQLTSSGWTSRVPDWSPDGSKILFTSDMAGSSECECFHIYTMNTDGTNITQLTFGDVKDSGPLWSPDGTKIAFHRSEIGTSGEHVYLMDSDGSDIVQLTDADGENVAAWSPDGTRLAISAHVGGPNDVYILDLEGDAAAPDIDNLSESDDPINRDGCPEPTTITIRADVIDDSPLDWVRLYYLPPGGSWTYTGMSHESGDSYKATVGPFPQPGTLQYFVAARDEPGNEAQTTYHTVGVSNCNRVKFSATAECDEYEIDGPYGDHIVGVLVNEVREDPQGKLEGVEFLHVYYQGARSFTEGECLDVYGHYYEDEYGPYIVVGGAYGSPDDLVTTCSGCEPDLTVFEPEVDGCEVTINGVVGSPCGDPVERIDWDWDDGTSNDSWFPASHTYDDSGTYDVTATAHTEAGYTASDTKQADMTGCNLPSVLNLNVPYVDSAPAKSREPMPVTLKANVKNTGARPLNNLEMGFYLGEAQAEKLLGSETRSSLSPGESFEGVATWTPPHNAGARIIACVHSQGEGCTGDAAVSSSQVITVSYTFPEYRFDVHSYPFDNWSMTLPDFQKEVVDFPPFLGYLGGDPQYYIWKHLVANFIYAMTAQGGHCYGMAQSSIVFWDDPEHWSLWPGGDPPYFEVDEETAKDYIRDHHARQVLQVAHDLLFDTSRWYSELEERIKEQRRPAILSTFPPRGIGHSVVAYKIVEMSVNGSRWIYLYDNEDPMTSPGEPVSPRLVAEYAYYRDVFVEDPVFLDLELFKRIFHDIWEWLKRDVLGQQASFVAIAGPVAPVLTDQYGRRVGFPDGEEVAEIPGAGAEHIQGLYVFEVPAELQYSLAATSTVQQGSALSSASGSLSLSYLVPLDGAVRVTVYDSIPLTAGDVATTTLRQEDTEDVVKIGVVEYHPDLSRTESVGYSVLLPLVLRGYDSNGEPPNSYPDVPTSSVPADGATDRSPDVNLNWTGGDLDGDSVTYDVYLEANDGTPYNVVCDDASSTFCDPGTLD